MRYQGLIWYIRRSGTRILNELYTPCFFLLWLSIVAHVFFLFGSANVLTVFLGYCIDENDGDLLAGGFFCFRSELDAFCAFY